MISKKATLFKRKKYNLFNIVINGNFANGITKWNSTYGLPFSATNNIGSMSGNGSSRYPTAVNSTDTAWINGHVIYFRASARVTNAVASSLNLKLVGSISGNNDGVKTINTPVLNTWYNLSGNSVLVAGSGLIKAMAYHSYVDNATSNGKVMELKNVMAFDLTAIFGAGKEPTAATIDAMITGNFIYWEGPRLIIK